MYFFFFLLIQRPPRSTQSRSSAASDVYKRQEEDHYGLEKPKERIMEYLAIRKLAKKMKGPILCLVGPPGVGKTSLGKSVARSLGRKFVRMSCLLYTSPSPRDRTRFRMPPSA